MLMLLMQLLLGGSTIHAHNLKAIVRELTHRAAPCLEQIVVVVVDARQRFQRHVIHAARVVAAAANVQHKI